MNGPRKRTGEESCDGRNSDGQLLGRFVDQGDEDAFAVLVSRYHGLVLGACRRTLRDEHSVEDAFQATFLALVRRASKIRNRSSLAGWLYSVAYRTALRANAKRYRRREEALRDEMTVTDDILARVSSQYEQQLVDEELYGLPPKYREPLVLRYLMGKSNRRIAVELGLKVGVVEGRLKRGKDHLRVKLVKRGVALTAVLASVRLSAEALQAATADSLIAATVKTAAAFQSGGPSAGTCSDSAIRLAEKELAMKTSAFAVTASSMAVVVAIAGLTFARAGDAARQPGTDRAPATLATIQTALLDAPPAESGELRIRLAGAEKLEAKLGSADFLYAAEEKIEAALREPTELDFFDEPLQTVMDFFKEQHQIEIQIDTVSLEAVGIATDEPVTRTLSGLSLQSGLNLILRDLDLTWIIRDEVLTITTQDEAENNLITSVYDVSDLVTYQDKSGEAWADHETLIDVLTTTIEPDTWEEVGGVGSIKSTPVRGAEVFVVYHTRKIHGEIQRLFDQLRAIAQETGGDELPVREKPTVIQSRMGRRQPAGAAPIYGSYGSMMGGGMGDAMMEDMLMSGSAGEKQPADQAPTSRARGMNTGGGSGND